MVEPTRRPGFSASDRQIVDEDQISLTSVGVDIGSSTSHLVFSRLELERQGTRYVVVRRTVLNESEILLTPYTDDETIDADALARFIDRQYEVAGIRRDEVDTGALILTGIALRRRNSRAIGELFASEAGRFVAVSAGDRLESTMAAHGSGAVAGSASPGGVTMNIDLGGGTTKVAICSEGRVAEVTALDIGARLLLLDGDTVVGMDRTGLRLAAEAGVDLRVGHKASEEQLQGLASYMADRLLEVIRLGPLSEQTEALLRLPPLAHGGPMDAIFFSGGVSEFIYGRETRGFGDLGPLLAQEIQRRVSTLGTPVTVSRSGIRATVIGASQYTIQVSGNTIFLSPVEAVPMRNVPVVRLELDLDGESMEGDEVRRAVERGLARLDLTESSSPVALALRWGGSATFRRLEAFCQGVTSAMSHFLDRGDPLVLVSDGDIGGLLGLHLKEEMRLANPVVSIDGIDLREFDYIDIGALIPSSGAVPVVIKSLVFPAPETAA